MDNEGMVIYIRECMFPHLMSKTPGGKHYNREKGPFQNAIEWNSFVKCYVEFCNKNNLSMLGGRRTEPLVFEDIVTQLSVSGNLRKLRNKWKRIMREAGLCCEDHLWRREDGRIHDIWGEEWAAWRKEVYSTNGQVYIKHAD